MRLRSGAVTAFYAHPNPLASQIILFVMAALALIMERRRNAAALGSLLIPAALIAALLLALWATQSKGAVAACAIAIGIWLATLVLGRMVSTRPRATVFAGWIVALVAATAVIGLLRAKPDALGRSILFRYMYWQGACDMIADQGVLGVGANNFGRHFTRYKSVECPEEVESPHSWPMQFASEWGLIGLAGFLLLALGTSLRAAAAAPGALPAHSEPDRAGPGPVVPEPVIAPSQNARSAKATLFATTKNRANAETLNYATKPQSSASGPHSIILWIAAVFLAAFVPWIATLGESNVVFVALHVGVAALPWFVGMALVSLQSIKSPGIPETPVFAMAAAIAAGLVGFLIHTSIDLALFIGGPATTFFALAAILLAVRESRSAEGEPDAKRTTPHPRAEIAAALVGLVLIVAIAAQLARPAATLADSLVTARSDNRPSPWDVYNASAAGLAYHEGHAAYRLDATAGIELIEQLMRRVQSLAHSEALLQLADECRRRDPNNSLITAHLSGIYRQRYEITHNPADFQKSIELYRVCIDQYPTAPMRHIHFANLLEEYANATHDTSPLREAAAQLRTALDLESRRIYVSQPNRMKPLELNVLNSRIQSLSNE
ncbi:MAG: O-antigen ligase family protein [Planctomycetes bacterium]|nr:O-antigen ligase family protein [Planctomycetota bacterium]